MQPLCLSHPHMLAWSNRACMMHGGVRLGRSMATESLFMHTELASCCHSMPQHAQRGRRGGGGSLRRPTSSDTQHLLQSRTRRRLITAGQVEQQQQVQEERGIALWVGSSSSSSRREGVDEAGQLCSWSASSTAWRLLLLLRVLTPQCCAWSPCNPPLTLAGLFLLPSLLSLSLCCAAGEQQVCPILHRSSRNTSTCPFL